MRVQLQVAIRPAALSLGQQLGQRELTRPAFAHLRGAELALQQCTEDLGLGRHGQREQAGGLIRRRLGAQRLGRACLVQAGVVVADNRAMKPPKRLQTLIDEGLIDSVSRQLMSGKEAMVFVV